MMEALNLAGAPLAGLLPADFHFLRPEWLFALIPGLVLALLAARRLKRGRSDWAGVVDPHLLRHLAVRGRQGGGRWPVLVLLIGWLLASLAMAGPTWQKLPSPTLDQLDPTVLVLSLGRSMDAADEAPSRLVAARHKMEDILARMRGGQVGLIIYADVPFIATPLTEDTRVLSAMLPELSTNLMPDGPNRPDLAILRAAALLKGAGAAHGRIVLLSDGAGDDAARTRQAAEAAGKAGYTVSIIGVGDASPGAGIPPMDDARLKGVADAGRGVFSPMSVDSRDLDTIFAQPVRTSANTPLQDTGMTADTWLDMGPWLLLPLLPLAALAFRRGWIAVVLLALSVPLAAPPARAQENAAPETSGQESLWRNLWQRPDQQAAHAFAQGDYAGAARRFEDPNWRAGALYKAGDFDAAVAAYDRTPGADYNRGNALARAGKLEEALAAYDAALAATPDNADALFNRDLVEQLLKKEEEEQQNGGGGSGGGSGGGGENEQQDQQGEGGQSKDGQNKDQQQGDSPRNPQPQNSGAQDPAPQDSDQQDSGQQPTPDGPKPGENGSGPQETPQSPSQSGQDGAPDPQAGTQPDLRDGEQQDKPEPPGNGPDTPQPDGSETPPDDTGKGDADGPNGDEARDDAPPQDNPAGERPPEQAHPGENPQEAPEANDTAPQEAGQHPPPMGANGPTGGEDDAGQPGGMGGQLRPMSEQDQNSEQALRMVPDDPSGLLRARIRAYYSGLAVTTEPEAPR